MHHCIAYLSTGVVSLLVTLNAYSADLDQRLPASEAVSVQSSVMPGEPLSLDQALERALQSNRALAESKSAADALQTIPSQAGSLPDPRLGFNALGLPTDTFDLGQEAMTQMQVALSQEVPFPGKLALRRSAAQHSADAGAVRVDELRLTLAGEVRSTWWRLLYIDRSRDIVEQNQELMRQFVEIAETKYKVGRGLQQDVLLAQLELSRLLDLELDLRGQRRRAQADLNALLDQPADTEISLSQNVPIGILPELAPEAELLELARSHRPLLAAQRLMVRASQAELELARKAYYPDFRLGAAYGFREGDSSVNTADRADLFSVMFSVNVPLYFQTKQSKAVEQHTFQMSRRAYAVDESLRQIEAAVSGSVADYQQARDQVILFRSGIIPQARQTVESMLAGYQVNQVDFLNLVRAQITLYNFEINHWKAISQAKEALARLAARTGVDSLYE